MGMQAQAIDNQSGALMRIGNKLAATLKRAEAAEAEVKRLREALADVGEMIQQLPMGCDDEADPDDDSPSDAVAHLGGLILQRVRQALGRDGA